MSAAPQLDRKALRTPYVWAVLLTTIAAGAVFQLATPASYTAAPFLAAAPAIAVGTLPFRRTAVVIGLSVATALSLTAHELYEGRDSPEEQGHFLTDLASVLIVSAVCLVLSRYWTRRSTRIASLRSLTVLLQECALPTPLTRAGNLAIAHHYEAADSDADVGGDAYGAEDTPYGLRILVADVRGKGVGAIKAVTVLLGAFREAAHQAEGFQEVVRRTETSLAREGARRGGLDNSEGFTTALFAEVPRDGGPVKLINRGHPAPLLLLPGGEVQVLEPSEYAMPLTMPQSLDVDLPDTVDTAELPYGGTLLLFTDGVTEARNREGVFLDPTRPLSGRTWTSPESVLDALLTAVAQWTNGTVHDDMALLAVTRVR